MKKGLCWLVVLAILGTGACADMSSSDILTSGIYADIVVSNNSNNSINVQSSLTASKGLFTATYIKLEGGDSLSSTYLGALKTMKYNQGVFGNISYTSAYAASQPYSSGNAVQVSLYRPNHKSAPNSIVTLPDPISGLSLSASSIATGQILTASWATVSGKSYSIEATIQLSGCLNSEGKTTTITSYHYFSDGGSFSFKVDNVLSSGYSCPSGSTGKVTISRIRYGSVDPAYEGGTIKAVYNTNASFSIL